MPNKQLVLAGSPQDVHHNYAVHVQRPARLWHCISGQGSFGGRFQSIEPEAQVPPVSKRIPGTLHKMALLEVEAEH